LSDFLGTLVDRLLDRGPILQRRQPALFEPVPDATRTALRGFETEPLLAEEQTVVERHSSPTRVESPIDAKARPLQPPPSNEASAPPQEQSRPKPRYHFPDIEPSRQLTRQSVHGETSVAGPVIEPQVRLVSLQPSQIPMPQAIGIRGEEGMGGSPKRIDTIVERRTEREVIRERIKAAPTFDQAPVVVQPSTNGSRQSAGEHEGESLKRPLTGTSEVNPRQQEAAIKPLVRKQPTPPRGSGPVIRVSRPEPARTTNQAPPSILVTIGRVEVRATLQTASGPRAGRPAGPKLSLEAYLRSRAEGN